MDKTKILKASRDFDNTLDLSSSRPVSNNSTLNESPNLSPDNAFVAPAYEKKLINKKEKNISDGEKVVKKKGHCKLLIQFLITHLGMIVIVVLYVAGGAFLFKLLEQHTEIQNCQLGEGEWNKLRLSYRSQFFNYIYFNTTSNPWLPVDNSTVIASLSTPRDGPSVYNPKITRMLIEFRDQVHTLRSKYRYTGQNCETESLWTYFSALLFTMTIVTTIGYGHVAPITWEGQIVCICYATLGIPLFLMSVAKISSILGDMFRYFYGSIFCYACNSYNKSSIEKKKKREKEEQDIENNYNHFSNDKSEGIGQKKVIDDDEDEEDEDESKDKVTVPLIFVIISFAGYSILGAYLFSSIEEWDLLESSYFAFITLATVGFGDYSPGISYILNNKEALGGRNLLIAAIYAFFGMAILAMCFDLMQDELVEKVSLIAQKIGFSKQEQADEIEEFEYEKSNIVNNDAEIEENANETVLDNSEYSPERSNPNEPVYCQDKNSIVVQKEKKPRTISVKPTIYEPDIEDFPTENIWPIGFGDGGSGQDFKQEVNPTPVRPKSQNDTKPEKTLPKEKSSDELKSYFYKPESSDLNTVVKEKASNDVVKLFQVKKIDESKRDN